MSNAPQIVHVRVHFDTTEWSLVLAAGARGTADSERALARLCQAYWPALYAYARRRVRQIAEAQDLTQAFFERLLAKNFLAQATPERGRFRAFLITAFKHFLANEWAKAKALKRGGAHEHLSLDFAAQDVTWSEPADEVTPERLYERKWAMTVLSQVMSRLAREMERAGKGRQFEALKEFIGGTNVPYAAAAAQLGMSEPAARMAASRLRNRYGELLREEIAQTVAAPEDIGAELLFLLAAVSS
jgi:RNA polymerase sigma-70 factor (ECF subfamily)